MATWMQLSQDESGLSMLEQLAAVTASGEQLQEAPGIVRALTRVLLRAVTSARQEHIRPLQLGLQLVARRLSWDIKDRGIDTDPRYLLGRIDAMIDLSSIALDQSLSTEVIQQTKRKPALPILKHLVKHGDTQAKELAVAIGIRPNYLSNTLKWMEARELIRRTVISRAVWVSLGPKGEATLDAIAAMESSSDPPSSRSASEAPEAFLDRADLVTLSSWLLSGFATGQFLEVYIDPSRSIQEALTSLFSRLPIAAQQRFKSAIADALGQWRAGAQPPELVEELAELALATGATEAIPVMAALLGKERFPKRVTGALIRVLTDFRAVPQARQALQQLFYREALMSDYSDAIFLGLCASDRENYSKHLARFLSVDESYAAQRDPELTKNTLEASIAAIGSQAAFASMAEIPIATIRHLIGILGWPALIGQLKASHDAIQAFLQVVPMSEVFDALPKLDKTCLDALLSVVLDPVRQLVTIDHYDDYVTLNSIDRRFSRVYNAFRGDRDVFNTITDLFVNMQMRRGIYASLEDLVSSGT